MKTKYYAVPGWIHPLAIKTEPGPLTKDDLVRNLVRMALMEDHEEMTVEESFQASVQQTKEVRDQWENMRWQLDNDREINDILMDHGHRKMDTDHLWNQLGEQAVPILEAMKAGHWLSPEEQTEESATESLLDYLEPYNLRQFVEEFYPTEWD